MTIGFRSDSFAEWGHYTTRVVQQLRETILPAIAKNEDIAILSGYQFDYHIMDWQLETQPSNGITIYAFLDDLFARLYELQSENKITLDMTRWRRDDRLSLFSKNITKLYYLNDGSALDEKFMVEAQKSNHHLPIEVIRFGLNVEHFDVKRK